MPHKPNITRRPAHIWKEPKRKGSPSMTAEAVRRQLGYRSLESIHNLVKLGPEHDGLAGYIPADDGIGWQRVTQEHGGVQTFFYPEDVEEWDRKHPIIEKDNEPVSYSDLEKRVVLEEAEKIKRPDGSVYRKELRERLAKLSTGWGTSTRYRMIKQILDDAGIPVPPKTPKTEHRRKYRMS